jgi:hypothetical protein
MASAVYERSDKVSGTWFTRVVTVELGVEAILGQDSRCKSDAAG